MKTKEELIRRIRRFKRIFSPTDKASYSKFEVDGSMVRFTRDNTKQRWALDIDLVYAVYRKEKYINTVV